MKTYTKQELQAAAAEAARRYGVDPVMYVAQIAQESAWNPKAVSSAGAKGLAQFMPITLKDYPHNPNDPMASLDAGAKYMSRLVKQFGSEDLARQAYNWGQGNLRKHLANPEKNPLPKETAEYNAKIYAKAGVAPKQNTTQTATRVPEEDTRAVGVMGRPINPKPMNTKQAATLAMSEMNQGLPAGALGQSPVDSGNAFMGDPAQGNWQQALASMQQPALMQTGEGDNEAFMQTVKDQAAREQDRALGAMFADIGEQRNDTTQLPSSIDRYLDKLLSA
jgi:hypothetical protein